MEPVWSPEEPATPEIQITCKEIKPDLEKKLGKKIDVITAISFIRLSLCGATHYVIKVRVADEYMLVTVIRDILQTSKLELRGYQLSAPIRPFVPM